MEATTPIAHVAAGQGDRAPASNGMQRGITTSTSVGASWWQEKHHQGTLLHVKGNGCQHWLAQVGAGWNNCACGSGIYIKHSLYVQMTHIWMNVIYMEEICTCIWWWLAISSLPRKYVTMIILFGSQNPALCWNHAVECGGKSTKSKQWDQLYITEFQGSVNTKGE